MNGLSVIIPSRNEANLVPCIQAIREAGETCRIIVVDDGLDIEAVYSGRWYDSPDSFRRCNGVKPFVFARNVNIGIRAAGTDDVIILNDDALLRTPGGFTSMQEAATRGEYGILGSATNNVGNENQFRRGTPLNYSVRQEPRMLCFVCVLIPRATLDTVGLLDERYTGYGMDDDDYCLQVRRAGLRLGVYQGCFVDHSSLTSSYRGPAGAGGDFTGNMKLFIEKWGVDNWGNGYKTSTFKSLFPKQL